MEHTIAGQGVDHRAVRQGEHRVEGPGDAHRPTRYMTPPGLYTEWHGYETGTEWTAPVETARPPWRIMPAGSLSQNGSSVVAGRRKIMAMLSFKGGNPCYRRMVAPTWMEFSTAAGAGGGHLGEGLDCLCQAGHAGRTLYRRPARTGTWVVIYPAALCSRVGSALA